MRTFVAALAVAGLFAALSAAAQTYPDRQIRTVVPFPPGGGFDNIARVVAPVMAKELGQSVVIENRAGATGQVGTEAVARAKPDGYTLLYGGVGPLAIAPHLRAAPYDTLKDFVAISMLGINEGLIVVHPGFPAADVATFVAALRQSPGKYSFATAGAGSVPHLVGELFKTRAGVDMAHIPYKGDAPAMTDVIGGTVPIMFTVLATAAPFVQSGQVRPIAALGAKRFAQLPNVPTLLEAGFPGLTGGTWLALYAPAGTPEAVITRLNAAVKAALSDKEVTERLTAQGTRPAYSSPAELATFTRDEFERWGRIVRERGIKAE